MPIPFYHIYDGAAFLAGAEPWYHTTGAATGFVPDFDGVPDDVWRRRAAPAHRTRRSPRLHHRLRRVLFGNLSRRNAAAARPARSLQATGPRRLPTLRGVSQFVEALQSAGPALGLLGRRCGHPQGLSALPYLSRLRPAAAGAGRLHRGLGRRRACAAQPRTLSPEFRVRAGYPAAGAKCPVARRWFLSVAGDADRRR